MVNKLYDFGLIVFLISAAAIICGANWASEHDKVLELEKELEDCRERANHANGLEGNYA